jgi:hypothetical protein
MKKQLLTFLLLGITNIIAFAQVPSYVPTNGLVGYWPFNGNANDESGNLNHGTVNGATLTADRNGDANRAYNFDGYSITLPISNVIFQKDFSISIWVNASELKTDYPTFLQGENCFFDLNFIPSKNFSYEKNGIGFSYTKGCQVGQYFSQVGIDVEIQKWMNIIVKSKNKITYFYLNGQLVDIQEVESLDQGDVKGSYITVGNGFTHYQFFSGKVDDIAIYSRALNDSEIQSISQSDYILDKECNEISPSLTKDIVGFWPFCGNAKDKSDNKNDGLAIGVTLDNDRFNKSESAYYFNNKPNYDKNWIKLSVDSSIVDSDFSISIWSKLKINSFYPLPCAYPAIFEGDQCYISNVYSLYPSNNGLNGYYVSGNCNNNPIDQGWSAIVNPYDWNHSVYVSKNDTTTLFVNGKKIISVYTPSQNKGIGKYLKIGRGHVSKDLSVFNGWIDDIIIWKKALTETEITGLYTFCKNQPIENLMNGNIILKNSNAFEINVNPKGGHFYGQSINNGKFDPAISKLGKNNINYKFENELGCQDSANIEIVVYDTLGNVCKETIYDTVKVKESTYDTLKIKVKLTTGLKKGQMTTMNVYPNPTSDVLIIASSDVEALKGYTYSIVDLQGKEVYKNAVNASNTEVPLKSIGAKGVYVLHIIDELGVSIDNKKIILE